MTDASDASDASATEDAAALARYGAVLADGIDAALPGWVERSVQRLLLAWTGAADPEGGTVQPDVIVLDAQRVGVGYNVYNTTGAGQTLRYQGAAGRTMIAHFKIQNDSDAVQFLTPRGCAGTSQFKVSYFLVQPGPDIDMTQTIVDGAISIGRNPGQTETWRVVVKIKAGTPVGAKLTCRLQATIGFEGPTDVGRLIVKRV